MRALETRELSATPRRAWLALIIWCGIVVAVSYGSALQLPFFFDDLFQIPFVLQHAFQDLYWPDADVPYAYYRPLTLTAWKLAGQRPWLQHLVNLLLHGFNGVLVALLAGRLWRATLQRNHVQAETTLVHWARRFLSATFFLLFPFSYQAIPFVGALTQILMTTLVLLALYSYLRGQHSGRRFWLLLSLFFTVLAPLAHENGVLVGPLLAAILITCSNRHKLRRLIGHSFLWLLPALVWLPLWWLVPKGRVDNIALNHVEAIVQNGLYFLQGLGYPLTWLGSNLRDAGLNDLLAVALLGAGAAVLALAAQRLQLGPRRWFPWLWCVLTMLPSILFLPFDYVINGPRLLMLFSVGVAWLWADVAANLLQRTASSRPQTAVVISLSLLVLGQNLAYIRSRMDAHLLLGDAVDQATHLTQAANAMNREAVFINFPSWLAPAATYAVGHEGVLFWPDYAPPPSLVSAQTGQPAQLRLVRHDATRPQAPYFYGVAGSGLDWRDVGNDTEFFTTTYARDQIQLHPAATLSSAPSGTVPIAHFQGDTGNVALLEAVAAQQGENVVVRLTWHVATPPTADVTVFVHLVDASGQLVAQADGDPVAGTYPLVSWTAGQVIEETRFLPLAGPGASLRVGLYHRNNGERLLATVETNERLPDNAFSMTINGSQADTRKP